MSSTPKPTDNLSAYKPVMILYVRVRTHTHTHTHACACVHLWFSNEQIVLCYLPILFYLQSLFEWSVSWQNIASKLRVFCFQSCFLLPIPGGIKNWKRKKKQRKNHHGWHFLFTWDKNKSTQKIFGPSTGNVKATEKNVVSFYISKTNKQY